MNGAITTIICIIDQNQPRTAGFPTNRPIRSTDLHDTGFRGRRYCYSDVRGRWLEQVDTRGAPRTKLRRFARFRLHFAAKIGYFGDSPLVDARRLEMKIHRLTLVVGLMAASAVLTGCKSSSRAEGDAAMAVKADNPACPFSNKPVSDKLAPIAYRGVNVGFCCPRCVDRFATMSDADKQGVVAKINTAG